MQIKAKIFFTAVLSAIVLAGVYKLRPPSPLPQTIQDLAPAIGTQQPVDFAAHKALYNLKMVAVETSAGITGVSGQMYYEQDDTCDAWTSEHRFATEYQYPERRPVKNTNHYVSWEAKDGNNFYFNSERQEGRDTTELLRGSVQKNSDGTGKAVYARPGSTSYDLPKGYILPMAHTNELIRRARSGEKFFDAVLFDGTDEGGPVEINTFIGKKVSAEEIKTLAEKNNKIDQELLVPEAWRVRMAVFPLEDKENMSPSYEMNMILHANGVVSYALVDYKNFEVEQSLSALEKLPTKPCP